MALGISVESILHLHMRQKIGDDSWDQYSVAFEAGGELQLGLWSIEVCVPMAANSDEGSIGTGINTGSPGVYFLLCESY